MGNNLSFSSLSPVCHDFPIFSLFSPKFRLQVQQRPCWPHVFQRRGSSAGRLHLHDPWISMFIYDIFEIGTPWTKKHPFLCFGPKSLSGQHGWSLCIRHFAEPKRIHVYTHIYIYPVHHVYLGKWSYFYLANPENKEKSLWIWRDIFRRSLVGAFCFGSRVGPSKFLLSIQNTFGVYTQHKWIAWWTNLMMSIREQRLSKVPRQELLLHANRWILVEN